MTAAHSSGDVHPHGFGRQLAITIVMGLIVATVLTWSPVVFGISLVPERLSWLLQDQAQRQALKLQDPAALGWPPVYLLDLPPRAAEDPVVARREVAAALSILDAAKASVVLLDIKLGDTSSDDPVLIKALRALRHSHIVLPVELTPRASGRCAGRTEAAERVESGARQLRWPLGAALGPSPRLWYGHVETDADGDGVFRAVCPVVTAYGYAPAADPSPAANAATAPQQVAIPSVALLTAQLASKPGTPPLWQPSAPALWRNGLIQAASAPPALLAPRRIHFVGDGATDEDGLHRMPGLSLIPPEILADGADRSHLAGATVIIGSSSMLTTDVSMTPLGSAPGLIVVANLVANFAGSAFLGKMDGHFAHFLLECVLVIFGSIIFVLLFDRLSRRVGLAALGTRASRGPVRYVAGVVAKAGWLLAVSYLVGFGLVLVQAWLAAQAVAENIAVDPAIGIVAILAERLFHIAGIVEDKVHAWVACAGDRIAANRLRQHGGQATPSPQRDTPTLENQP